MTLLYLVSADDVDGENKDLFVVADTPEEAVQFWFAYYEASADYFTWPVRVIEVPGGGWPVSTKGAINWDTVTQHWVNRP